jgi:hypothetical protein
MNKPITPKLHGLLDYTLAAGNLAMPTLLKMPRGPRIVFAAFGVIQGTLNAITAQPLSLRKKIPFAAHGVIEKSSTPLYIVAPLIAGAQKDARSRAYWIAIGVALVAVYNLTDWNAKNPGKK